MSSLLRRLGTHAGAVLRNAFASPGYRRFGVRFARDYLRFAGASARRWGDVGPGELRLLGQRVRYSNRMSMLFLLHEIFVGCAYDFEPQREDPLIVDGGANLGATVIFFARRFPRARIVALEPHPEAFRLLEENTRGLGERVERREAALTGDGGPAALHAPGDDAASLSSSLSPLGGAQRRFSVRGVRLSTLIEELGREVDYLKLDIEGAEYAVLGEAASSGALARVRELGVEYHHAPGDREAAARLALLLEQAGFAVSQAEGISGVDGLLRGRRRRPEGDRG